MSIKNYEKNINYLIFFAYLRDERVQHSMSWRGDKILTVRIQGIDERNGHCINGISWRVFWPLFSMIAIVGVAQLPFHAWRIIFIRNGYDSYEL